MKKLILYFEGGGGWSEEDVGSLCRVGALRRGEYSEFPGSGDWYRGALGDVSDEGEKQLLVIGNQLGPQGAPWSAGIVEEMVQPLRSRNQNLFIAFAPPSIEDFLTADVCAFADYVIDRVARGDDPDSLHSVFLKVFPREA